MAAVGRIAATSLNSYGWSLRGMSHLDLDLVVRLKVALFCREAVVAD